MARSTFFRRTSLPALIRPGAKLRMALIPAATSFSVTTWADSPGTATIAIWRLRALASRGRSSIDWMVTPSTALPHLAGSSSKIVEIRKPWRANPL